MRCPDCGEPVVEATVEAEDGVVLLDPSVRVLEVLAVEKGDAVYAGPDCPMGCRATHLARHEDTCVKRTDRAASSIDAARLLSEVVGRAH